MTIIKRNTPLGFSTRAIHYGYDPAEHKGAVSPPVYFTSTYSFENVEANELAASRGGFSMRVSTTRRRRFSKRGSPIWRALRRVSSSRPEWLLSAR